MESNNPISHPASVIAVLALGALVLTGLIVAAGAYRPRTLERGAGTWLGGTSLWPPAVAILLGNIALVATDNTLLSLFGLVLFLGGIVWLVNTVRARRAS
jgi:hypothetical protein